MVLILSLCLESIGITGTLGSSADGVVLVTCGSGDILQRQSTWSTGVAVLFNINKYNYLNDCM